MRLIILSAAAALGACAATVELPQSQPQGVFAATHGTALAPPGQSAPQGYADPAPPEGLAPGGLDFGQWRSADVDAYARTFAAELAAKTQGRSREESANFLIANGFSCAQRGDDLECRIEIMHNQCARDWYAVFPEGRREPVAGADVMCLGALSP